MSSISKYCPFSHPLSPYWPDADQALGVQRWTRQSLWLQGVQTPWRRLRPKLTNTVYRDSHSGRTLNTTWTGQGEGCLEGAFSMLNDNEKGDWNGEGKAEGATRTWARRGEIAWVFREQGAALVVGAEKGKEKDVGDGVCPAAAG